MTRRWQDSYIKKMTYKSSKLGQTDLFSVCDRSSSVGLCLQDYKSLRIECVHVFELFRMCVCVFGLLMCYGPSWSDANKNNKK